MKGCYYTRCLMDDWLSYRTLKQFFGYGAVGLLNTALSFLFINIGIILTGANSGGIFILISFIVFVVLVFHSFMWNRYLIFKRENPRELHREYLAFFLVTGFTSLINLGMLHVFVDVIGAPADINARLWANIAIAFTIPVAVTLNFLGYKLFVFKEK
jgi:putative flippase GtrA